MHLTKSSNTCVERKGNPGQSRAVAVTSGCDSVHHSSAGSFYAGDLALGAGDSRNSMK